MTEVRTNQEPPEKRFGAQEVIQTVEAITVTAAAAYALYKDVKDGKEPEPRPGPSSKKPKE